MVDLFYYGSQDVPLPLEGGRGIPSRLRKTGAKAFCESCSSPVDPADLKRGRASEIFGLVLCETCRMKARAEERIELYFCDHCQVSVPVCRVDTGEALAGDGRILCLDCRRKGNGSSILLRLLLPLVLVAAIVFSGLVLPELIGSPDLVRAPEPDFGLLLRTALGRELTAAFTDDRSEVLDGRIDRFAAELEELAIVRDLALDEVSENSAGLIRLVDTFKHRMLLLETEMVQMHRKLDELVREPLEPSERN
jgi:hypothetical protein